MAALERAGADVVVAGYMIELVRLPAAKQIDPKQIKLLRCSQFEELAKKYGVRVEESGERLAGDREHVLGLLLAGLDRCEPWSTDEGLLAEKFTPGGPELAAGAAPPAETKR